jgi:hypothetical protein
LSPHITYIYLELWAQQNYIFIVEIESEVVLKIEERKVISNQQSST